MYEILVLGATFAAAGIARRYQEKCLVLERRAQAGYEFFCAEDDLQIYSCLKECCTVFCVEVVSVQKNEDGFLCVTHGVDGFRSYKAKRVVDTRCNAAMSRSKTFDLLIDEGNSRSVMQCPVSLACDFSKARAIAKKMIEARPEGKRLIVMADEFNYCVKEGYPKTVDGILYLPSKAYATPTLAFEAGQEVEK